MKNYLNKGYDIIGEATALLTAKLVADAERQYMLSVDTIVYSTVSSYRALGVCYTGILYITSSQIIFIPHRITLYKRLFENSKSFSNRLNTTYKIRNFSKLFSFSIKKYDLNNVKAVRKFFGNKVTIKNINTRTYKTTFSVSDIIDFMKYYNLSSPNGFTGIY